LLPEGGTPDVDPGNALPVEDAPESTVVEAAEAPVAGVNEDGNCTATVTGEDLMGAAFATVFAIVVVTEVGAEASAGGGTVTGAVAGLETIDTEAAEEGVAALEAAAAFSDTVAEFSEGWVRASLAVAPFGALVLALTAAPETPETDGLYGKLLLSRASMNMRFMSTRPEEGAV
jgi:hypothetical protein